MNHFGSYSHPYLIRETFDMKKYLLLILFSFYSVHSFASDKLHGSVWKTIDDATNQPRALVRFSQDKNGVLSQILKNPCSKQKPINVRCVKELIKINL